MAEERARVLVTGASGNAGQAVCRRLLDAGYRVRMADVAPPRELDPRAEFLRVDTRTSEDVRRAVDGVDAVVHLAAWHSAHKPPVSDETIFAVNVDGTFNLISACREHGIEALVFASSMAFGWRGVYSVTKVIGEDLCRSFHEMTGASVAMLRYHEFIPRPYLEFGAYLLQNGIDRRDVAESTLAALKAAIDRRIGLFLTIVHTNHGMPGHVVDDFARFGPDWCEEQVPGARHLLDKYKIPLPEKIEQHDLSEARRVLGWEPRVGFLDFLRDLRERDARDEDVFHIWVPSELPG